jgi:hypothetical protein
VLNVHDNFLSLFCIAPNVFWDVTSLKHFINFSYFFFFYWRYNPLWVLAFSVIFFHCTLSSHCFLHHLTPIICKSSLMPAIHLFLGFPLVLVPTGINLLYQMLINIYRILIVHIAHMTINPDRASRNCCEVVSRQSHKNKFNSERPYGTQDSCIRLISFLVSLLL